MKESTQQHKKKKDQYKEKINGEAPPEGEDAGADKPSGCTSGDSPPVEQLLSSVLRGSGGSADDGDDHGKDDRDNADESYREQIDEKKETEEDTGENEDVMSKTDYDYTTPSDGYPNLFIPERFLGITPLMRATNKCGYSHPVPLWIPFGHCGNLQIQSATEDGIGLLAMGIKCSEDK